MNPSREQGCGDLGWKEPDTVAGTGARQPGELLHAGKPHREPKAAGSGLAGVRALRTRRQQSLIPAPAPSQPQPAVVHPQAAFGRAVALTRNWGSSRYVEHGIYEHSHNVECLVFGESPRHGAVLVSACWDALVKVCASSGSHCARRRTVPSAMY